jgi:transglutaminase-like putative cysteine protease
MLRVVTLVFLLLLSSTGAAKDVVKRAKVRWTYTIAPAADTETIKFRCLIPRDRDTWQRVTDLQFSHAPVERITDGRDALARFFFRNPKAPVTITIDAAVELRSAGLLSRRPAVGLKLPDEERRTLTSPERYVESDDARVLALAEKVGGGTVPQQLLNIQKRVEETLERGEFDPLDHGAVAAIERGKGDCSEYADLFVALCRAKRIPAVVCEGFTIDVGLLKRKPPHHAWVMVWLADRGWTRFDPLDVASRIAKHEAQSSWYIHLTDQRNSPQLTGHLYRIDWVGAEATVESRFEIVE